MRNLLLSSVTLLLVPAVAIASPEFNSHTHTTPIELKPISSSSGIKLASVCFLGYGDCGDGGFDSIDGDDGYIVDTAKQCKNEGFVNSCSSGYCMDGSCPYDSYYGNCIKENCPTNSSPTCTGDVVGKTACGGDCKKCCSDVCTKGSKSYTGSYASTTECGSKCYYCNTSCPSGTSTSYSGSVRSYNECNQACKACSDTCPSGYTATATSECYDVITNECGNTCYKAKSCCSPCSGDTYLSCSSNEYAEESGKDGCGNSCYRCYKGIVRLYGYWHDGLVYCYPNCRFSTEKYARYVTKKKYCEYKNGSSYLISTEETDGCNCWGEDGCSDASVGGDWVSTQGYCN